MKRYMSLINSGVEGLEFPDLVITTEDGHKRNVKIKRNEFIPLDKLAPEIVQQSAISGCISNAIRSGWMIVLEDDQLPPVDNPKTDADRLAEYQKSEADKQKEIQDNANKTPEQMANDYTRQNLKTETIAPGVKIISTQIPEPIPSPEPKPKIEDNSEYTKFETLQHVKKLSFISTCKDKVVLQTIIDKSTSKQLINNATKQLKSLA